MSQVCSAVRARSVVCLIAAAIVAALVSPAAAGARPSITRDSAAHSRHHHGRSHPRHPAKKRHPRKHHVKKHRPRQPHPKTLPKLTGPVVRQVSFSVTNVNQTSVACTADGKSYTVRGEIVLPANTSPRSVTLYLHGVGYGEFFWTFDQVPGYDYALAQAQAGHASVLIDELGYGASDHPPGNAVCIGSQATIAHEIVQDLRSGSYTASPGGPSAFSSVALAGHSLGGLIAQVEAANFHDVNALAVLDYSDAVPSSTAISTLGQSTNDCLSDPQSSDGAPDYAPFGQTDADFDSFMFYDADPAVVAAVNADRTLNPCGDLTSVTPAVIADQTSLSKITVPVLFALGSDDALFTPPAAEGEEGQFTSSSAVTDMTFPDTGHAITFGHSAATVTAMIGGWLSRYGF